MKIYQLLELEMNPRAQARYDKAGEELAREKEAAKEKDTANVNLGHNPSVVPNLTPSPVQWSSGQGSYSSQSPYKDVKTSVNGTPISTPSTNAVAPVSATEPTWKDKAAGLARTAGNALTTGAKAVAKHAPAVGQGISDVAQGVGTAGTGIAKAAGDIGAQVAGGLTQTLGAAGGGLVHGFKTASKGNKFMSNDPNVNPISRAREITGFQPTYQQQVADKEKQDQARLDRYKNAAGGGSQSGGDKSNIDAHQQDELDQLKSRLDSIEQLVRAR